MLKKAKALAFLILFGISLNAQEIVFKHITDKEGLYYNWIWHIFKDSEGFMWFSSQEGAFRYDGNEIKDYRFKSFDGFSYLNIYCVFEDSKSNIWFGTNEGLIKYQRENNIYTRYRLDSIGNSSSNFVNAIIEDHTGILWIATGFGLIAHDTESETFKLYNAGSGNKSLRNNNITELLFDSKDNLWIGDNHGLLYLYIPHNDHFLCFVNAENSDQAKINILYEDNQGYLWVGYEGSGASKFDTWSKQFVRNYKYTGAGNQIANNYVRGIIENNNHTIWFGTEKGLSILDRERDQFTTLTSDFKNPNGLNDNAIYCIYKEENGDIWIGTFFGGVNVYFSKPRYIQSYLPDGTTDRISGKAIGPMIIDKDFLWIGTEDNGLNRFNPADGTFQHFTQENSSLSYDNIHALCKDHQGDLWVGTYTGGLNLLKPGSNQFLNFTDTKNHPGLPNNSIYSLFNDRQGNLWIGTRGGLSRYNYDIRQFENMFPALLGDCFIWDIEEDSTGNIWMCTYNRGIFMLEKAKDYEPVHINLPVTRCITLHIRNNGDILVGTEKNGLIIYDPYTKDCEHLTVENSLPDNTINGILEDNTQAIWFTTNKGLCKTKDFCQIEVITVDDGLITNRFNYNSTAQYGGKLYFGSTRGLVVINPDMQLTNTEHPKLHITSISFPNRQLNPLDLGESVNYLDVLKLKHPYSSFSIKYVGINFRESSKVRYAIMMVGIDNNWNYVGNSNIANYNNLNHGDYQFRVRTVDRFGKLQDNEKTLNITIVPPWWKTAWAKTIFAFLLLSVITIISYLLVLRTKAKHALQIEKLEKQKIKDINDARIRFFTNISHEFKTPLTLIKGPINKLIKSNGISLAQRKWYHTLIKNNTERLLHLINELLEFRNITKEHLELKLEHINIDEIIENISESYFWIAESNKINFTINIDKSVKPVCLDSVKFEKILNNLLVNAFAHTPKHGYIIVESYIKKDHLYIQIKNSGKGLSSDTISKLFNRDYSDHEYNELNQGSGIGLAYTKTLVELHRGFIDVYSLENVETSFNIKIPANLSEIFKLDQFQDLHACEQINQKEEHAETLVSSLNGNLMPKILIAEDVKELRDFLSDSLGDHFNTHAVSNGHDAFKIAQAENPDVIISDVMMPKLNGFELCSKIKNTFTTSHIRVVLLTVLSEDSDKLTGYKSGADAYISKPFDIELLISRIKNLLKDSYILKQKFQKDPSLTHKEITFSNPDEKLLSNIIETVQKHMGDPDFDVDQFAKEIGLSKSTLYRKMKSITGLPINEFVQILRLKRAAELLKDTEMTISEIAFKIGFNDPYYFSRAFKKNFNLSPKKFREQSVAI